MENLEVLLLGANQLKFLHSSIGNLKSLKRLYLWNNQLESLSDPIIELESLEVLRLRGNCLKSLPAGIDKLRNLKEIYLWGNHLETLPAEIGMLPKIELLGVVIPIESGIDFKLLSVKSKYSKFFH